MSSVSQTGATAEHGASISLKFVVLWPLSFVVPWLFLTIVQSAIFHFAPEEIAFQAVVLQHILTWLLIGCLQSRLLRGHLRRYRLWLIATLVGGFLGNVLGSYAHAWMAPMVEAFVIVSNGTPEWLFLYYSAISITAGAAIGTALLGFLQSFCLDDSAGGRLLWLFASVVGGCAAAVSGYVCGVGYGKFMFRFFPDLVFPSSVLSIVIAISAGMAGGMIIYGLLTGAVLRRLLIRVAQRRKAALIARFE